MDQKELALDIYEKLRELSGEKASAQAVDVGLIVGLIVQLAPFILQLVDLILSRVERLSPPE